MGKRLFAALISPSYIDSGGDAEYKESGGIG